MSGESFESSEPISNRPTVPVGANALPSLVTFTALAVAWQAFVVVTAVPTVILPSPVDVATAIVQNGSVLAGDAIVTAVTASLGLALGIVVGLTLAFATTSSRSTATVVLPYVIALRITPVIAIAPLVFLWFGRGITPRAFIVATMTVFPIVIASYDGLTSTPDQYLALAASVDATPTQVFLRVRVPAAAPSILAGIRIAATLSVIGAVVAEFVALRAGLGYRIFETASRLETAETFAALFVLALLGVVFYMLPDGVQYIVRR